MKIILKCLSRALVAQIFQNQKFVLGNVSGWTKGSGVGGVVQRVALLTKVGGRPDAMMPRGVLRGHPIATPTIETPAKARVDNYQIFCVLPTTGNTTNPNS